MRIKRFCAPDMRQAMRLVREELGADAVILSNKTVDEGVEIVAAMDFDHEMFQNQGGETIRKPAVTADRVSREPLCDTLLDTKAAANEKPGPTVKNHEYAKDDRKSIDHRLARDLKAELKKAAISHARPKPSLPTKPAIDASQPEPDMEPVLEEMRKEFDQLRDLLTMHITDISWAESIRHNPVGREVLRRLNQCGFSETIAKKIVKQLDDSSDINGAWDKVRRSVSRHLTVHDDNLLDYGGIVALVGPTGVGKTTSIAKLAAKFCLKYGARKIALVTADNYRIAAYEQLNTYGRILDIPVRTAHDDKELAKVLDELMDKRLVLIDTAGISQRDMRLADQFPTLIGRDLPIRSYLVMSASTQYATMQETIQAFKVFKPHAAILTKLDEAVSLAAAISALIENQLPVSYVCDGQKVPENLKTAKQYGLAEKCFNSVSVKTFVPRSSTESSLKRMQACG